MSNGGTTELRSCTDVFEAEMIRTRLAAAGIPAMVSGTDVASAFAMGGAPQQRLLRIEVANEDLVQAQEILERDRQQAIERGTWVCEQCSETNESTFDLCWRCNSPVEAVFADVPPEQQVPTAPAPITPAPITIDNSSTRQVANDGNPYQPVLVDPASHQAAASGEAAARARATEPHKVDETVESAGPELRSDVRRAFLASIVGWLVFPPLVSLYSVYELLRLSTKMPKETSLRVQVSAAWCINLVAIAVWSLIWSPLILL